ncbi:hypothetical protein BD779DRAFT_1566804 [Infundibulicybe gibba]|nr:hypothetical protein BD779DRAFT_1566804 [Infundibulicybe gibba]
MQAPDPHCGCTSCHSLSATSPISYTDLPPPPSSLISSNRAPSDSEITHSRTAIYYLENHLKNTIATDKEPRDMEAQIVTAGLVRNAHKAILSPLRRFPPELLAEIFTAVVSGGVGPLHPEYEPYFPAIVLTRICSLWRKVALDSLHLWTKVGIDLIFKPEPLLSWLKQYMVWSKHAPLHLTVECWGLEEVPETRNGVLNIITPHAHRWEHVDFSPAEWDFQFELAPIRGHLDSLKSLRLSFSYSEPERRILDVYEHAPYLTTLILEGASSLELVKLPWRQIKACQCDEFTTALHAIQFAENLLSCHLYMDIFASIPPTQDVLAQVCNTNLKILEVARGTIHGDSLCLFFSSLTLPSLRILKIQPQAELVSSDFWLGFFSFFHRSCRLLTTLKLRGLPFPFAEFTQILELVPQLVSLDIGCDYIYERDNGEFDNEFMDHLNANYPGCLVPCLTSLSIHGQAVFDEASVVGMVASRRRISSSNMNAVALLQHLVLGCSGPLSTSGPLSSLREFVLEGLMLAYEPPWEV